MRSKMGCVHAFDNGEPMLRNISAPFLNALDDSQQVVIFRQSLCQTTWFHQGKTRFWGFKMVPSGGKKRNIFDPPPTPQKNETEHNSMHIYIYIYAVGSITWPYFGHFKVNNLAMVGSITWPSFFEPIKIGVLGDFLVHSFQGVVQN